MPQQTTPFRLVLLALLLSVAHRATRAVAQAYTPPPPPLTTGPCKPTKKDPCPDTVPTSPPAAADKFAYPGDVPAGQSVPNPSSTDPFPFPKDDSTSKPAPQTTPKTGPASDPFPFPKEDSKLPPGSASSSSSDDGAPASRPAKHGNAVDDDGEDDTPATPPHRTKLPKVEDLDQREAKDLEVARFYLSTGDYIGAYNRAKDAVDLYPDDAEAHFALAAAAQKLKKNDEAVAEFKSYLKLEPDGDHVKIAQRALAEIH